MEITSIPYLSLLSTPKCSSDEYDPDKNFDVYNHVKATLVQLGVPKNEIAFIHDAENDVAKQALFDNVRAGSIRILLGSTEKMGAGTNVQNKIVALHHLDTPYRPRDLEQREGRGIRQGNENPEIDIFTYVTERTFDAYMYQILENKQRFISQINRGELTVREAQDIDETALTYAEIKAITSANPLIKRKHEVELAIGDMQVLERQYRFNRYGLQDKVVRELPQAIEKNSKRIEEIEKDIALRNGSTGENFVIMIGGKPYTEKKDAAELLHKLLLSSANVDKVVAVYQGFQIIPNQLVMLDNRTASVRGNGDHRLDVSNSAIGTLTRIDNLMERFEENLKSANERLQTCVAETEAANAELSKPFEHAEKLTELTLELEKINAELNLDKTEVEAVIDDTKFQNEVKDEESGDEDENDGEAGEGRIYDSGEREFQEAGYM